MAVVVQDATFVLPTGGKRCQVFADTVTIKVPAEKTNGAYSISEDITPAGAGAPPHVHHREDEMFYVLEGEFEFKYGDRKFNAEKGSLVSLPRDVPHGFKNTGDTAGRTLVFLVPGGLEKVFEEISLLPPGPPDLEKVNSITRKYGVEFLPLP